MATKKAKKNAAAVALGRKGGKKRAENLSPESRSEQARSAVQALWGQSKLQDESLKVHGDPLDTPEGAAKKKGK